MEFKNMLKYGRSYFYFGFINVLITGGINYTFHSFHSVIKPTNGWKFYRESSKVQTQNKEEY